MSGNRIDVSNALKLAEQLEQAMRNLRGDWSEKRDSPYLETIYACVAKLLKMPTPLLPREFLRAVQQNADTFDGHFNDGRIMRDGRLLLPPEVIKDMKLPEDMKNGVSGNLAKMLGAKPDKPDGYCGTYDELNALIASIIKSQKVSSKEEGKA